MRSSAICAGVPVCDDAAVEHDARQIGHAEDFVCELLDDHDREPGRRDPAHMVVELFDDERGQPHRKLVDEQHGRIRWRAPGAIASICCSPPDSVPAVCVAPFAEPGELRERPVVHVVVASARCSVAMRRFSVTVRFGKMPRPSGIRHTPARASASRRHPGDVASTEQQAPRRGTICPEATARVVDFPAPFGPSNANTSPGCELRGSTPCSTSMRP